LIKINDPLKRQFYEIECIKGIWSVRELRRQVSSLYYERSAVSKDKTALSDLVNQQAAMIPHFSSFFMFLLTWKNGLN